MATEDTRKNNGNANAGNAPPQQEREPEPTPSDVVTAIGKFVRDLERWPQQLQRRVLEGVATALGINRNSQPAARPQQRQGNNNR